MSGKLARGVIHGRTIELDRDLGLNEGEEVEVRVSIVPKAKTWGQGILRSAGGWVDHPEMDSVMGRIHRDRRCEQRPQGVK